MQRRVLIKTALAAAVCGVGNARAHTPYKQWQVYRDKHLLIGCLKNTPETYTLAKKLVALFAEELPRASARVARAPHLHRIASLMATNQLDTSIIPVSSAVELAAGAGDYAIYGPVPLRVLFAFGDLLYVGMESMPEHHALMIFRALQSHTAADHQTDLPVPWHRGIARHDL